MAVEMHVPNKSYDGYYGGVKFSRGVGVFKDEVVARELANRYDYEIVEIEGEVKVEKVVEAVEEKPAPKKRTRKPKAGE